MKLKISNNQITKVINKITASKMIRAGLQKTSRQTCMESIG